MSVPERHTGAESSGAKAAPTRQRRLLLVEDEAAIRDLVSFHLDLAGYECTTITSGTEALETIRRRQFDLILLDVVLPGIDGITLCQTIRREGPNSEVPILILTARCEESDKVVGLNSGADDYVTKPFSVRELLARVQALLRRPRSTWRTHEHRRPALTFPGITIDPKSRGVICEGREIELTHREFDLLYFLASNAGTVFDRDDLLTHVWEEDVFVTSRGVDTLVRRLRTKIENDPRHPTKVITVWGSGYKFGES